MVVLVGQGNALSLAVKNNKPSARWSGLRARLRVSAEKEE
jgi:hypothetical protein